MSTGAGEAGGAGGGGGYASSHVTRIVDTSGGLPRACRSNESVARRPAMPLSTKVATSSVWLTTSAPTGREKAGTSPLGKWTTTRRP
eukprot:1282174-Prymnesium_polylepis.1